MVQINLELTVLLAACWCDLAFASKNQQTRSAEENNALKSVYFPMNTAMIYSCPAAEITPII